MASPKTSFLAHFASRLEEQEKAILGTLTRLADPDDGEDAPSHQANRASHSTSQLSRRAESSATERHAFPSLQAAAENPAPAKPGWGVPGGVLFSSAQIAPLLFAPDHTSANVQSNNNAVHDARMYAAADPAVRDAVTATSLLRRAPPQVPAVAPTAGRARSASTGTDSFPVPGGSGSMAGPPTTAAPMQERQSEQIRSLLATLQAMTDDAARQRQAAAETARALDAARRAASEASGRVSFLEAESASAAEAHAMEVDMLHEQMDRMAQQMEAERKRADDIESRTAANKSAEDRELLRAQRDKAAAEKDLASMAAKISEARAEAVEVRTALAMAQAEVRTLQARLGEEHQYEEQLDALASARDDALAAAQRAREQLDRVTADANGRLAELQKALASTASKLSSVRTEKDRVEGQLQRAGEELEEVMERADRAERQVQELQVALKVKRSPSPVKPSSPVGSTSGNSGMDTSLMPATDGNMMALMLYAQKLEEEVGAERRRTAAARLALALRGATLRSLKAKWNALAGVAGGGAGSGHASFASPAPKSGPSPSTSHLEMLASTPLTSLGLDGMGMGMGGQGYGGYAGGSSGSPVSAVSELEASLHDILRSVGFVASEAGSGTQGQAQARVAQHVQKVQAAARKALGRLQVIKAGVQNNIDPSASAMTNSSIGLVHDPQARLRAALQASHDRADRAEMEAAAGRREAGELRLRLTALYGCTSGLLTSLGVPSVLASSSSSLSSSTGPTSPGQDGVHGADNPEGSLDSTASLLDAGLFDMGMGSPLSGIMGSGQRGTSFGSPSSTVSGGAGRRVASPSGTAGKGAHAATPEAVAHAINAVSVLRVQVESLCALLDPSSSTASSTSLTVLDDQSGSHQGALVAARAMGGTLQAAVRKLEAMVKTAVHRTERSPTESASRLALHDRRLAVLATSLSKDVQRLREAEEMGETLRGVREDADAKAREAQRTIQDLRTQVEAAERLERASAVELSRARDKLGAVMADCERLRSDLDAAQAAAARARADAEHLRSLTRETLSTAREQFSAEADALSREREDLVSRVEELEGALERARQEGAAALAQAKEQAEAEMKELRTQAANKEAALSSEFQRQLSDRASSSQSELDQRLAEISMGHSETLARLQHHHAAEVASLSALAESERNALLAAHEGEVTRIMTGAEERVAQLSGELGSVRELLASLHQHVEGLSQQVQDKDRELQGAKAELEELRTKAEQLTMVLASVTGELENQMLAAAEAKQEVEDIKARQAQDAHVAAQQQQHTAQAASQGHHAALVREQLETALAMAAQEAETLRGRVEALTSELQSTRHEAQEEVEAVKEEMAFALQAADDHARAYVARMLSAAA